MDGSQYSHNDEKAILVSQLMASSWLACQLFAVLYSIRDIWLTLNNNHSKRRETKIQAYHDMDQPLVRITEYRL